MVSFLRSSQTPPSESKKNIIVDWRKYCPNKMLNTVSEKENIEGYSWPSQAHAANHRLTI